jgi:hypothetical protein
MTKDMYFEMCDQMGQEPVESEIPLDLNDFPDIVQAAFTIYSILSDQWIQWEVLILVRTIR